jgi:hypothetical protein
MNRLNTTTQTTTHLLKQIISSGYGRMVTERLEEGWEGYLITFMFKSLRGSPASVMRQMEREVERVYATLLPRIIREPGKHPISELPLWVVCPDFPVPKHSKKNLRDVTINGGSHMQGSALIPPWNRMNCGLDEHFEQSQSLYVRPEHSLARVHAVPITSNPAYVTEYALKSISRRRLVSTRF